ncbi:hypothetical protein V6N12_075568 [Hibiscus sabdariffa]|uniref:Uncharacterized protein n=1 Tax=Hibiscus sabdariffa TaxID=183260 RepID=A0ABR2C7X6_9ROSI
MKARSAYIFHFYLRFNDRLARKIWEFQLLANVQSRQNPMEEAVSTAVGESVQLRFSSCDFYARGRIWFSVGFKGWKKDEFWS